MAFWDEYKDDLFKFGMERHTMGTGSDQATTSQSASLETIFRGLTGEDIIVPETGDNQDG